MLSWPQQRSFFSLDAAACCVCAGEKAAPAAGGGLEWSSSSMEGETCIKDFCPPALPVYHLSNSSVSEAIGISIDLMIGYFILLGDD